MTLVWRGLLVSLCAAGVLHGCTDAREEPEPARVRPQLDVLLLELQTTPLEGLTPEAKIEAIRERQRRGERVLMIGDGINDAPVLAAADVSCAPGEGAALAHAAADLLLLDDSLRAVATGVDGARRALSVMRQNLAWAFVYNLAAVPLAALGLVAPWVAAIGMSLSSLAVVLNARRLAVARS